MKKNVARITIMYEYELDEVKGLTPEQVLLTDISEMIAGTPEEIKIAVVRKEIL